MPSFLKDIQRTESITSTLASNRNKSISNIMNIIEALDLPVNAKKKVRSVVLDELNGFYTQAIKILTYVQEKKA
jgi:hypothetical protein